MADRFSLPSSGVGVDRFNVWPQGSDSYDHAQLQANWDMLDGILGLPAGGDVWPPTSGLDGGIYKLIALLEREREPIGTIKNWWRPSLAVPLTTYTAVGWVVVDGSTLTAGNHDFPGIAGSVTLPNLLNAYALGADPNTTLNQAGVAVSNGNVNNANGAPGAGGTGGFNSETLDLTQIPAHDHGGGNHTHTLNRQVLQIPGGGSNYLINVRDSVTSTETTNASGVIIQSAGGGLPVDNRPRYVGLIPIMKVKYVTSLS